MIRADGREYPDVVRYNRNLVGRDWVIGDIHGYFSRAKTFLRNAGFNEEVDRLFKLGDLVDRGPESAECLDWIDNSVMGNHEDMLIQYVFGGLRKAHNRDEIDANYLQNGGAWILGRPEYEQNEYAYGLIGLPYAIEIETPNGVIGLVHAEVPGYNWNNMIRRLQSDHPGTIRRVREEILWGRYRFDEDDAEPIKNIRAVIHGHNFTKDVKVLANTYYIDTGGWLADGFFTAMNITDMELHCEKR